MHSSASARQTQEDRLRELEEALQREQARVQELELAAQARVEPGVRNEQNGQLAATSAITDSIAAAFAAVAQDARTRQLVPSSTGSLPVMSQLRPPNIDKFAGDRERSKDFASAIDKRLNANGQQDSVAGLDYAVGHFTGLAATWWRYYTVANPSKDTWAKVKPAFTKEFELVDESEVYEKKLFECSQSGTVTEYVTDMLEICMHLPDLSEGFKMRQFARGANGFLRNLYATREAFPDLLSMARYTLALVPKVDPEKLRPDGAVVAAMPARFGASKGSPFQGVCWTCGAQGHKSAECSKVKAAAKQQTGKNNKKKGRKGQGSGGNPAPLGKVQMGRYSGGAKVHNIDAGDETDSLSDDELRSGNDLA